MNEQKKPFNLLDFFHVGYKKKTPEQLKYANFHRRMFAFTLDSIVLMLLVAPIVDFVFAATYGPFPIDIESFRKELQAVSEEDRNLVFLQTMKESGAITRWLNNAFYQLAVFYGFEWALLASLGATPGKLFMRIKIVDAKTEKQISPVQIILRLFGYLISVSFFTVGFLWIGLDKRKQGWHDKLADTVVITIPFRKKTTPVTPAADP